VKSQYDKITSVFKIRMVASAALAMLVAVSGALASEVAGKPSSAKATEGKPLKVVILAGQSNMQEPAKWHTLAGLADSAETRHLYDKLVDENDKVRIHKEVHVAKQDLSGTLPLGFGGRALGRPVATRVRRPGARTRQGRRQLWP
jgi:hypothetical protein